MMRPTVRDFLFGTLRGRLILSVAAVHAVMMTLFIGDLTLRQRAMLLDRQAEEAMALAETLATTSAGWIAANDVSGLQELVEFQRRHPELIFAMLTDGTGLVLANTDKSQRGTYLLDLPREVRQTVLTRSPALVDVAAPAMIGGRQVGWARVGIGQKATGEKLAAITRNGLGYALAAILGGSVIAWFMGQRITRRLYAIQKTVDQVRTGDRQARAQIDGDDESAVLAHEFNSMLDAIAARDVELRTREEKYRSLIRKVQTAVVLHDGQGHILDSNPLAHRLLGLSSEQLIGKALLDPAWHFLGEDGSVLPVAEYPVSRVLATRLPVRGLVTGIKSPERREVTWVLVNAEPESDDEGKITQVIVSFVDITARKRAEAALQKSAAEAQDLYDHAPCGYHSIDADGTFLRINDTELAWLGYSRDEIIGRMKLPDLLTPESLTVFQREYPAFQERGWLKNLDLEMVRKDGSTFFARINATAIKDTQGRYLMSRSVLDDVTESRRAEEQKEQYFKFFRLSLDPMCIADPLGCFLQINPAFTRLTGFSEAELLAKPFIEFVLPEDRQRTVDEMKRQIQGSTSLSFENRYRCKDGTSRLLSWKAYFDRKDSVTYATAHDITAKRQADEALLERERHSQSLLRLSRNLERAQTYSDALDAARSEVGTVIGYKNLWVYLLTDDKKYLKALMAGGDLKQVVMSEEGTATLTIKGDRMLEEIAAAREIVVVEDARTDARTDKEKVAKTGIRTVVNIPIILFDRHFGVMGTGTVGEEGVRLPTTPEREYLIAVASHMAVTLDRIHLLTERRRTEEALRLAGAYNRSLIEASLDPLVTIGPDGKITDVNASTEAATGRSRAELIGTDFSDYFTEPEKARAGYQRVFRDGLVRDYPLELRHRDGRLTSVLYNASVYRDEQGNVIGVFAAARDITERKQAEEKLRHLAAIVESSDDAIIGKALDERILSWNAGAERIYGYTAKEMVGQSISILVPPGARNELAEIMARVKRGERIEHLETSRLCKDQRIIAVSLTISPIKDARGLVTGASTIARDITERKRAEGKLRHSEARYRALHEDNPLMIFTLDPEGTVLSVNPTGVRQLGYAATELEGQSVLKVFHPDDRAQVERSLAACLLSPQRPHHWQFRKIRNDGAVVWVEELAQVVTDLSGATNVLVVCQDITERKRAEEETRRHAEELRARNEELARFNHAAVDRELRMIRLKERINELSLQAGQPPPYALDFLTSKK